jgi:cytoskeletal protein RodZ
MSLVLDRSELAAFGAFLRDARERRGKTLQQVASETRIPWRHLDALEQGRLDQVPGGMYRRAEVRAFADAVGLDRGVALAHLEHVLEHQDAVDLPHVRTPLPEPRARNWTVYLALALLTAATLWAASRWEVQSAPAIDPPASETPPLATGEPPPASPAPPEMQPIEALPAAAAPAAQAVEPAQPQAIDLALTVTSSPDGARVLVDGISRGRTPVTIQHLDAGDHRVRVVLDGFVSSESMVRVGERPSTSVHVDLQSVR